MAIDGIGGVGALNVSSQTRTNTPRTAETQNVNVSAEGAQVQVESLPPVTGKGSNDNQNNKQQDRAGVQSDKDIAPEKIKAAVEDLNKKVKQPSVIKHTQLSFKYHDDTNRISITVTDSDTDEVIREIPPEKALDMLAKAWEMAGLLVDERR
ncbi:MAG: flagellar protein FlaG [Wujia sp.]